MTQSQHPPEGGAERHRRSIRLKGYDYTSPGGYFITLAAWQRECLFGEVVGEEMRLNELGQIVQDEWIRSAQIRREIELDEFVVMPNHFHAIIFIREMDNVPGLVGATGRSPLPNPGDLTRPTDDWSPLPDPAAPQQDQTNPRGPKPASIGALVAGYKSACTTRINQIRQAPGCSVWQRNYYERIIRNERELDTVRLYIRDNPRRWGEDEENPQR